LRLITEIVVGVSVLESEAVFTMDTMVNIATTVTITILSPGFAIITAIVRLWCRVIIIAPPQGLCIDIVAVADRQKYCFQEPVQAIGRVFVFSILTLAF
jgi:hypothetical protein